MVVAESVRRALSVNRVRGIQCARGYRERFNYCVSSINTYKTFSFRNIIYIVLRI